MRLRGRQIAVVEKKIERHDEEIGDVQDDDGVERVAHLVDDPASGTASYRKNYRDSLAQRLRSA